MFGFTLWVFFLLSSFDFYEARKKVRTSIQQRRIDVHRPCQWHETERNEHFGIWSGCFYFVVASLTMGFFVRIVLTFSCWLHCSTQEPLTLKWPTKMLTFHSFLSPYQIINEIFCCKLFSFSFEIVHKQIFAGNR